DVMMTEWVFYAGNWFEEKNSVAPAVNFLLKNGTSKKTALEINEHFEYYGAFLNRNCYNETATVSLHTLSRHFPLLVETVRELITDSVMPQDELDVFKQNMKQRLLVNLKKTDFVAGRETDALLFGEHHPYGKFTRPEDYDALIREELLVFYENYYRKGCFMIFAAGKLPADFEKLINRNFGDLPNHSVFPEKRSTHPATEKKKKTSVDEQSVQASIRIARPFPNRHHPDFRKAVVLNTLLGGFFGSRLMSNLREEKGYTYGVHSYLYNHLQESAWMISLEAGREVYEKAIEEVYREMQLLRETPVEEDELMLVKNYMMGFLLSDLNGPFQIIQRWKNMILHQLSEEDFYASVETIKKITPEELRLLATKYLHPEAFYEVTVL
ncbi:MAG: insulinase family protein, partial [Chitinophagaceae bacterium]|nr:insulinase family protein [Chitinophagaceae bacterium]